MNLLSELWPYAAVFLIGGGLTFLAVWFYNWVLMKGIEFGERRLRNVLGVPEAEEEPQLPTMAGSIKSPNSLIVENYELLFDLDLATFVSSGHLAPRWPEILVQIKSLVDQHFVEFPPDTNTVVVRTFKFSPDGKGEYVFEPLYNANIAAEPGE